MTARAIGDFGPTYFETNLDRFPVEPFNTYSNLIFLFILLFFCWRTRGDFRSFPASVLALPILCVGFVGGTLFHATRSYPLWLYMDFVPIALLVVLASLYFWNRDSTIRMSPLLLKVACLSWNRRRSVAVRFFRYFD